MTETKTPETKTQADGLAIQTRQLTKIFGSILAVDELDLDIKQGELFALLGPNGAGKTTAINMLCGLIKPTSGTASVMGHDINCDPLKVKSVIGVSPQETTLSERLTPMENLRLIGSLHGIKPRRLEAWSKILLETMGLSARAKDQVRHFSGGMKRRLSIAMALIHNPDIIFLDEPTLGLDPQARRAVWDYIINLKKEKTILLTTHYMEEADCLADRIGIIDRGKIVELGTSLELKSDLLVTHTMIVQGWNMTQRVVAEMKAKYEEITLEKNTMTITGKQLDFNEIVNQLQTSGAVVRSAHFKDPTLEDVFLKVTGKELRE